MSEVCFITLKPPNQPKHKTSEEGGKMVKVTVQQHSLDYPNFIQNFPFRNFIKQALKTTALCDITSFAYQVSRKSVT